MIKDPEEIRKKLAEIQTKLRDVATALDKLDTLTGFTLRPNPSVFQACGAIVNYGQLEDRDLAELLRFIADHMEE